MFVRRIFGAPVLLAVLASAPAAQLSSPTFPDVPYYPGGSCEDPIACSTEESERCLDVYLPVARRAGRATVLFVHGGGWGAGSKSAADCVAFCARLAELGHPVVACNYALACPGEPGFPYAIRDVRAALAWVRGPGSRPPFSLGPDVVAVGFSAGAHLAGMVGVLGDAREPFFEPVGAYPVRDLAVEGVIAISGPFDFYRFGRAGADSPPDECPCSAIGFAPGYPPTIIGSLTVTFLGCQWRGACNTLPCAPESANPSDPCFEPNALTGNPFVDASPVHWVSPEDPPFFFLYSSCDSIVPGVESRWMRDALAAVAVESDELDLGRCGHAFTLFEDPEEAAELVVPALRTFRRFALASPGR